MNFKINPAALAAIEKLKKDAVRQRIVASGGLFIIASMAFLSRTSGGNISALALSLFLLVLLTAIYFMFIRSYKKQKFLLKHIIEAVNVADGRGVFSFAEDLDYEVVEMPFAIGQLSMVLPTKEEVANFRGKYFTVFKFPIGRAYLVKEYWDDFSTVLNSLELKKEEIVVAKPETFFSIMHAMGRDLKYQFYFQCLYIVALSAVIAYTGNSMRFSFLSNLIASTCFAAFLGALTISPLLGKVKIISHLVYKMEIIDNTCYFYCTTVFRNKPITYSYAMRDISTAEWEVYQEVFFKDEKFMVLGAKGEKFYLVGGMLANYGTTFIDERHSNTATCNGD
ncbi:hypothetical protein ABIB40_000203 [Pedobacter sp. UYP30]|uniref:hypothetical protein n=1 Tax=Pedobacter sp. UYP30 TaxID=1756400 RepID=UPI003397B922